MFIESVTKAIKSSKLTEEEALKKIAPKFKKLFSGFEETISTFYVDRHKFDLDNFLKISFKNQTKIAKTHRESFIAFILYVNGCYEIYRKVIEKIKGKKIDSTLKMSPMMTPIETRTNGMFPSMTPFAISAIIVP